MSSLIPSGSASGTGSMSLVAPVTNSNRTVTLPDADGIIMVSSAMPAFSAYASSGTSLTSNTATKLLFDTELFDTNNNFASSRFTPTVAGYYQISGGFLAGLLTSSNNSCSIYKNGSVNLQGSGCGVVSGYIRCNVSGLVYLNGSTDYVELYGLQSSGASVTTFFSQDSLWFNGSLVRSA